MPQKKISAHRFFITVLSLILMVLQNTTAYAQSAARGLTIIRDTEIEQTLKTWIAPLLKAANISEDGVKIILVQSDQLNAFVAGGANIFIFTGLIEATKSPGELIGVMAHELGHIAGGHLIATRRALERASYETILGTVLGVGAAIATGNGRAAQAVIGGSQGLATRRFLSHTRVNESSADQAAMRFLETANMNPNGLVSFLHTLEDEELLPASQQSEYMRTHPITRNRIDSLENKVHESAHQDKEYPSEWIDQHARMKAKLIGFISPERVLWNYNDSDESIPARYARAISAYRQDRVEEGLKEIDGLINLEPENPYFYELKGQMLVDFARIKEALVAYQKAVKLAPKAGLLRIAYGHALIESNNGDASLHKAIEQLEKALETEKRSAQARRFLATAYGRLGYEVETKINLAEEAVLQRRYDYARAQAKQAADASEQGSRNWQQAQDILSHLATVKPAEN